MTEEETQTFVDSLRAEIVGYMEECGVADEIYVEEDVERILKALMTTKKALKDSKPSALFTAEKAVGYVQTYGAVYNDYTNEDDEWDCSCATPEMCQGDCETSSEFRTWNHAEKAHGRTYKRPIEAFKLHRETLHGYAWKDRAPCGCGCDTMENGMTARDYVKYMETQ